MGGQESAEQLALVEESGSSRLLKISCGPIEFGIPARVIEPHIKAYVVHAAHMTGSRTLADMADKRYELELREPIEFEPHTG